MAQTEYEKQLKKYRKEADEYYQRCKIVPCPEEIVQFVADCVEDESGTEVNRAGYQRIAKELGITLE